MKSTPFPVLFQRSSICTAGKIQFNHYICGTKIASLAQLVEQFIRNEQVVGSSPMGGSNQLWQHQGW